MFPLLKAKAETAILPNSFEAALLFARAPKLKANIDRLAVSLAKSLQTLAGASVVKVAAGQISNISAEGLISSYRSSGVAALLSSPNVPGAIVTTLDGTLVHTIVDLLCGSIAPDVPTDPARPITSIDQKFAHTVFALLAVAIESEWTEVGFTQLSATSIDRMSIDIFEPSRSEIGCAELKATIFGHTGLIRLAFPQTVLGRFASEQAAPPEEVRLPATWSSELQDELQKAPISLDAYLDARNIDLQTLATLEIGQILVLPKNARANASLTARGKVLFRGEIGQADSRYSLRIDEVVADKHETQLVSRAQTLAMALS